MKERGILFSAPMVRALLAGAKTQTRRIMNPQINAVDIDSGPAASCFTPAGQLSIRGRDPTGTFAEWFVKPRFGVVGDRLWVRETWAAGMCSEGLPPRCLSESFYGGPRSSNGGLWYLADGTDPLHPVTDQGRWKPGIHMVRWMSRITLEVTEVRVQRLQDISEEDARAEGCGIDWERVFANDGSLEGANYGCVACSGDTSGLACFCHPIGQGKPWRCRYANLWDDINGAGAWAANPWVWALTFKRLEKCEQGVPAAAGGAAAGAAAPDATGTG